MLRLVSLLGIAVIIGILFALSRNRKAISWRLVITGLLIQGFLGLCFLRWEAGREGIFGVGEGVKAFLDLSKEGSLFIFGPLVEFQMVEGAFRSADPEVLDSFRAGGMRDVGFVFATQVLPTLIFFSSLMGVLYYLGIMQRVVQGMAWLMAKVMGTSGAESLSACGNVFVGQTESPLMVRPYLSRMTLSEIHAIMTGGFCTIAGGVFALYVLYGIEPGHLMVASVMAVPAGLICTKMLWPETEKSETMGKVVRSAEREAVNVVDAAATGASDGLRLALNVGAMLIAFLGLVAVINWMLGGVGSWFGMDYLTLNWLLGWLFYPIALVMGVEWGEVTILAQLIGEKLVLTELVAYKDLGRMISQDQISPRTQLIASFALCGFANFGSVAIQIGGLGAMAPDRKGDIARLAVRAMFAGTLATCMTAFLAGAMGIVKVA